MSASLPPVSHHSTVKVIWSWVPEPEYVIANFAIRSFCSQIIYFVAIVLSLHREKLECAEDLHL